MLKSFNKQSFFLKTMRIFFYLFIPKLEFLNSTKQVFLHFQNIRKGYQQSGLERVKRPD